MYLYIYIHTSSLPASCLSMPEAHGIAAGYTEKGSGTARRERAVGRGYVPGMLWRGAFGACSTSFPSSPTSAVHQDEPRVSADPRHSVKDPSPKVTHSFLELRATRMSQQASPGHPLLLHLGLVKAHPGICAFPSAGACVCWKPKRACWGGNAARRGS